MLQVTSVYLVCICFTHVPNVSSTSDVCCIQVFHISEVDSHGAQPERRGRGKPRPADGACWGATIEVCGAPEVVRMEHTRLVVLIPAPGPARAERGGGSGGRNTRGRQKAWGGGVASGLEEREERVGRKEQRARRIPKRA
jgi:hypothetical protein